MIEGRTVLAVITARGGSKGLPRKNVLPLKGRPLIAWTVAAALQSRHVDRVIVSSDDAEIIAAARAAGAEVPFVRPADLASDTAGSADVLMHALDNVGQDFDLAVLLQPTSPLRSSADIDACIKVCAGGVPACVTICEAPKSPYSIFTRDESGHLHRVLPAPGNPGRRQDLPAAYVVNGAVYVVDVQWFRQNRAFITAQTQSVEMPKERSIDIDTAVDFALAEILADAV